MADPPIKSVVSINSTGDAQVGGGLEGVLEGRGAGVGEGLGA